MEPPDTDVTEPSPQTRSSPGTPSPAVPACAPRGRPARWLAVLCLGMVLGACDGTGDGDARARERATGYRGVTLEKPVPRPDFTLTDTDGEPFRFAEETRGRVTLLFFGYTNCPDICPAQMDILGSAYAALSPSVREEVRVVFVTADPARDTRERIRRWLDRFGQGFVGLRGPKARVDSIQRSLGLQSGTIQRSGMTAEVADGYAVNHTSAVLAFLPDGPARLAYPFGTRQRDWVHDLPRLVERGMEAR